MIPNIPDWFIYAVSFVLGTIFGSFFNVLIYRLPKNESIVFPPSHCPNCGYEIKPYDNIPIISFIVLKGKCRNCGSPISFRYPLVEFITGLLFLFVVYNYGLTLNALNYLIFFSILFVISFIDAQTMLVPDPLIVIGLLWGVFYTVILGLNVGRVDGIIGGIAGALIIVLIRIVGKFIYKQEVMGEGDVGILAMIGLYLGYKSLLSVILLGSFTGALTGVILIIMGNKGMKSAVPFGPFLSLGAFLTVVFSETLHLIGILW